jgi:prepilin-type N-terminal cleavage/methylation domain-containing protein
MSRGTPPRNVVSGVRRGRHHGLSLIEVLMALALTAMLLTAAGMAFQVSADSVQANDEFFRATQAARISMHQILTQVRRGSVQLAWDPHWVRLTTTPDAGQTVGDDLTYSYDATAKQLKLVTNDVTTDPDYVLASNVTDLTFDVEAGTDYNHAPCVARVTVMIKVKVGKNEVLLSGSAAPRRNLRY